MWSKQRERESILIYLFAFSSFQNHRSLQKMPILYFHYCSKNKLCCNERVCLPPPEKSVARQYLQLCLDCRLFATEVPSTIHIVLSRLQCLGKAYGVSEVGEIGEYRIAKCIYTLPNTKIGVYAQHSYTILVQNLKIHRKVQCSPIIVD